MTNTHFDIDAVLGNIKSKLKDQHFRYTNPQTSAEELLELTEVVESAYQSETRHNKLSDTKINDNIINNEERILSASTVADIKQSLEYLVEQIKKKQEIDSDKLESLIKEEIRKELKIWLEKNLPAIVKKRVGEEITKLTQSYFNK